MPVCRYQCLSVIWLFVLTTLVVSVQPTVLFAQAVDSNLVVRILVNRGGQGFSGSGFLVQDNNIVVTNRHVIEGANSVQVLYRRNNEIKTVNAKVVHTFREEADDLAVLRTAQPLDVQRLTIVATVPESGVSVTAIGFPVAAGVFDTRRLDFVQPTVSRGIISRSIGQNLQHDAPINGGNSGGPLLDSCNQVVGVNTLRTSGGVQGIFVAISSARLVDRLRTVDISPSVSASVCEGGVLDFLSGPQALRNVLLILFPFILLAYWLTRKRRVDSFAGKIPAPNPFNENSEGSFGERSSGFFSPPATETQFDEVFRVTEHTSLKPEPGTFTFGGDEIDSNEPRLTSRNNKPAGFIRVYNDEGVEHFFEFSNFPLNGLKIGRDGVRNNIVIVDPSVSRTHATIRLEGADEEQPCLFIEDKSSSNGTRLDRELVTGPMEVPHNCTIKFGNVEMSVEVDGLFKDPSKVDTITDIHRMYGDGAARDERFSNSVFYNNSGWQLSGIDENGQVLHIPLKAESGSDVEYILGRESEDVNLDHASVSRRHAVIRLAPGVPPTIADLGSTNGTRVDGEEVLSEPRTLYNANTIELGDLNLQLSVLAA